MRPAQRAAQIVAALVMAFVGVIGSYDLPNEWRGATTPWQHTVSLAVALYGVLGIAGAIGAFVVSLTRVALREETPVA